MKPYFVILNTENGHKPLTDHVLLHGVYYDRMKFFETQSEAEAAINESLLGGRWFDMREGGE